MTEWPRTIPFDLKCKLEQLQEWRSKPSLQDEWTTIREWLTKHGVEACPGKVVAATKDEVWKLMELHAVVAHGEDPSSWDADTREYLETLIKPT